MAAAVEKDKDWQVVVVKNGRVRDALSVKNAGGKEREARGMVRSEDGNDQTARLNYQSLIGTPIRIGDAPRPDKDLSRDSKVGGILQLPSPTLASSLPNAQSRGSWDLGDLSEWPSMGLEGETVPQLSSWNAVVKKPPLSAKKEVRASIEIKHEFSFFFCVCFFVVVFFFFMFSGNGQHRNTHFANR